MKIRMELDDSNLIKREDMTVPKMHLSKLPTGPVPRTLGSNREILPTKLYETLGMCSKMY